MTASTGHRRKRRRNWTGRVQEQPAGPVTVTVFERDQALVELGAGWQVTPHGQPHKTLKAANAAAQWLTTSPKRVGWEYQGVTLESGEHRVVRRRREQTIQP